MIRNRPEALWHLTKFNIVQTLSDEEKEKLSKLVSMKQFKKGDTIYYPAASTNTIYFLKQGLVKVIKITDAGDEQITDVIGQGELFGGFIVREDNSKYEKAVALKESLICNLDLESWNNFITENTNFRMTLLKIIGQKLRQLEVKAEQIQFLKLEDRVKAVLLELASKYGTIVNDENSILLKPNLTHHDIAKLAGTSRQAVTTVMRKLQDADLIDYNQKMILLKKLEF